MNYFITDCELRNLRPFTIQYYQNGFNIFLSSLSEQGIDLTKLRPVNIIEEHINNVANVGNGNKRVNELAGLSLNDIRWKTSLVVSGMQKTIEKD